MLIVEEQVKFAIGVDVLLLPEFWPARNRGSLHLSKDSLIPQVALRDSGMDCSEQESGIRPRLMKGLWQDLLQTQVVTMGRSAHRPLQLCRMRGAGEAEQYTSCVT